MNEIINVSRRDFLKTGAVAGGGLVLALHVPGLGGRVEAGEVPEESFAPNAFLRLTPDDSVTVIINHSEMGQGISTALAMIVADELDADWSRVRIEFAPVAAVYNHTTYGLQITGGSTSTMTEWDRFRKMGAVGRAMLIAAAATEWGVDPATCRAENGMVIHAASGRKVAYGGLVEKASGLKAPGDVKLKTPDQYRIIGKPTKRLDTREKIDGTATFGIDVSRPGMLVAVIARSPVFGGAVKSFNAEKAKGVKGVRNVVQIDRGIAVAADGFWAAVEGRDALEIEWDEGSLSGLDTAKQGEEYAAMAKKPGKLAGRAGDVASVLGKAEKKIEAVYELPYLAHAPMEPLNCVAEVRSDGCEVWVGTQSQTLDLVAAARAAGVEPEQVKLHTTLLGGGFGRRAVLDSHFVVEAVQVSKAVGKPVKVIWTREDDVQGGFYRPRAYHSLAGCVDGEGKVAAWQQRIVSQSIVAGTPFESAVFHEGVDHTAVEGAADMSYAIPNRLVEWHQAPGGVPVLWWRSVGHSYNAFVVESFLDELAHEAGRDPLEVRRELLKENKRSLGALELAASKAGWGKPLPKGRSRGIAVHESFGSSVAQVAEVSVSKAGAVRVHRVVCAVDCGPVVNPETVRAQMEGAIVFGLSAALHGEITFENGRVQQSNFHDYQPLRMNEMPEVEVHIVESKRAMGGVGETGLPPIAPAVTNAIFAATGKRVRSLPIRAEQLAAS